MEKFTFQCTKCGSYDVGISATEDDYNHIEVYVYCRDCNTDEEVIHSQY